MNQLKELRAQPATSSGSLPAPASAFVKIARYLPSLVGFALARFTSARWAVGLAVAGVVLEYSTLTIMLPLSGAKNVGFSGLLTDLWRNVAHSLGLPDGTRSWLWLFLLLLGFRVLLGLVQITLNSFVGRSIMAYLQSGAVDQVVIHEPLELIYKKSPGHYLAISGDESVRVGQVFFNSVQMFSALLAAMVGLVALFFFSRTAFVFTCVFLVSSSIGLGSMMGRVFRASGLASKISRQQATTFVEAINGIRSIRSMAGERFVVEKFRGLVTRYARALFFLDLFNYCAKALPSLFLIATGLIALFPGNAFMPDTSTLFFFSIIAILIRILAFLGEAVTAGGRVIADVRVAFDLQEVLQNAERPVTVPVNTEAPPVRTLKFEQVSYAYSEGIAVVQSASGCLRAGSCYALIGKSGSGKSTLADIFLGLLMPQQGRIFLNDVPYAEIESTRLRRHVVLVEQQTRIFSGTIWENIAFGLEVSVLDMERVIQASALTDFVSALPEGLQTELDYQGANLSGGQRQRIGLARALIRQPDVLILDEATSALDPATRDNVIQRVIELFSNRILLFITHDTSVSKWASHVWHMHDGSLQVAVSQT